MIIHEQVASEKEFETFILGGCGQIFPGIIRLWVKSLGGANRLSDGYSGAKYKLEWNIGIIPASLRDVIFSQFSIIVCQSGCRIDVSDY